MSEATIFRSSVIAQCLSDSLEEMISERKLNDEHYETTMETFDKSVLNRLNTISTSRLLMKGTKLSYNNCEGVWLFDAQNFHFTTEDGERIRTDRVKIVAVDQNLAIAQIQEPPA
jgi:hypothetical protein